MAKDYDFSDFDEPAEAPKQEQEYDFSDFEESKPTVVESVKKKATDILKGKNYKAEGEPTMGRAEAGAISFGQGTSMGLAPIASGIVGAGMELVDDASDALGLSTNAKLKKQGFDVQDEYKGLDGLLKSYYDSRDAQKKAQNTAFEEYPVQSIGMNIAGSLPTTIASGGATGTLAKILPNAKTAQVAAQGAKNAKLINNAATGLREGAKAGALTGFGNGDAKLLDGEIAKTGREVLDSTVGGSLVGGSIPIVGAAAKKLIGGTAGLIPGVEGVKTAFQGGRAGMKLTEEAANNKIKDFSQDLLGQIRKKFKEAGKDKYDALEYADEIGLKMDAGQTLDEAIDNIIKNPPRTTKSTGDTEDMLRTFQELKNGPQNKAQIKLDNARAKNIQKMEGKGYNLLDENVSENFTPDFVPQSDSAKKLGMAKQTFQKLTDEGDDLLGSQTPASKPVTNIVQQATDEPLLAAKGFDDINNMSLREVEELIQEVNRYTGDWLKKPTPAEAKARDLYNKLRSASVQSLEDAGQGNANNPLHKIFAATRKAGIEDEFMGAPGSERGNNALDKLQSMVRGENDIKTDRVFDYLKQADPKFAQGEETAKFLNQFRTVAKQNKPMTTTNTSGLWGSTQNKVNVIANKAGGAVAKMDDILSAGPEAISSLAQKFGGPNAPKAAQAYIAPLQNAAQADERKRAAIMYGLYQQPAFREMYQTLGNSLTGNVLDEEEQN